jgi:putative metallohydrolase (TIGR04338 family)
MRIIKTPRDNHRSRVYKADKYAIGELGSGLCNKSSLPAAERLETVSEIRAWVNEITSSEWWRKYRLPGVRRGWCAFFTPVEAHPAIRVKDGRGRRCAGGSFTGGFITMPKFSRNRHMILHELAHTIVENRFAGHGPEFCRVLLDLTHEFLGVESAERLRHAYDLYEAPYEDIGYTYEKDAA